MGRYLVGVRAEGAALDAALRRAFAPVLSDRDGGTNYSVRLGTDPTRFHLVAWANCPVLRTLDVERLIVGLVRFVGAHAGPPPGTVRTDLVAVVGNGMAVAAHRDPNDGLAKHERTLRQYGLKVVEAPWVDLDLHAAQLVVSDPAVALDQAGLDDVRSLAPPARRADPPVAAGRYPLVGVVVPGKSDGAPLPRPEAAFQIARHFALPAESLQSAAETLAALAPLTERVPVVRAHTAADSRALLLRLGSRPHPDGGGRRKGADGSGR